MARPYRQGADYFPLDVHLDDKFKFVEIKCGLEGFAILIKLLQKIYSYGYWYKWTEDEALLFSGEINADFGTVQEVVSESIKRGIFHQELHEKYGILTSKGIQKRYKEIVRRRKDVEVIENYLLIDNNFGVNDVNNQDKREHDDDKKRQSKEKVKEIEKEINKAFDEIWEEYPKKQDKQHAYKKFKTKVKQDGLETVLDGTRAYIKQIKEHKTEKQFIKNYGTFLNKESYKDDFSEQEQPQPQGRVLKKFDLDDIFGERNTS